MNFFSRLSRGEGLVVKAGGVLILSLFFFPWHKAASLGISRTAIQSPNSLQGTLALLLTVAMVAQILMAKSGSGTPVNPTLVRLQPVAGMAVVALLAWKLAKNTAYLGVGAYLAILLAAVMAYGGLTINKEDGRR